MIKKEFNIGDTAYIGKNMRVKFLDGDDIRVKTLKCDSEVKIVGSEKINEKYGKYGYYIEYNSDGKPLKSTHSISQFDFYSKHQWKNKLYQEALISSLLKGIGE